MRAGFDGISHAPTRAGGLWPVCTVDFADELDRRVDRIGDWRGAGALGGGAGGWPSLRGVDVATGDAGLGRVGNFALRRRGVNRGGGALDGNRGAVEDSGDRSSARRNGGRAFGGFDGAGQWILVRAMSGVGIFSRERVAFSELWAETRLLADARALARVG